MTQILKKKKNQPQNQILKLYDCKSNFPTKPLYFSNSIDFFLNNKIKFYRLYVNIFNFEWTPHSDQLKP